MNNTTETLTTKLHERSDRQLGNDIAAWLAAMPTLGGGFTPHHVPCGGARNLSSALYELQEALKAQLTPFRRDAEVTAFLAQVNTLQDVLDSQ